MSIIYLFWALMLINAVLVRTVFGRRVREDISNITVAFLIDGALMAGSWGYVTGCWQE